MMKVSMPERIFQTVQEKLLQPAPTMLQQQARSLNRAQMRV